RGGAERLDREVYEQRGVLTAREQDRGPVELAGHLTEDMDGLRLERAEVVRCRGRASGGRGWGSRGWGACHGSICSFRVVRSGPASGRWLAVQAALGFAATRPTPATGIVAGGYPRGARRAADGEIALAHQRVLQNPVRGD